MPLSAEPRAKVEIYPMASFPTLGVSDRPTSARWYCEGLGFTYVFARPE
jgi:hypothetical protein